MANGVFNISLGKAVEYANNVATNSPANSALVLVLLQANEADSVLQDYDTLADLLAAAGNTEATFTNYARKVLTDTDISAPTPDDTANTQSIDIPDQVFTSAGGTTDNTLTKAIICYDADTTAGTDANIIPVSHHDVSGTTNGNNLTAIIAATGFYTSAAA